MNDPITTAGGEGSPNPLHHGRRQRTATAAALYGPAASTPAPSVDRPQTRVEAAIDASRAFTLTDRDMDAPAPGFDSIADALADIKAGKFVVVLDDEDRENEGDLIIAAEKMTSADMAFMVEHTSGVVCAALKGEDLDRLRILLMVNSVENEESMYTAFTITVDYPFGTTTGISASDRAATVRALADPATQPSDFKKPGHIFPLRYHPGGVLVRPGHTEASVDLACLAGCSPAGVLCEIVDKEDGSMAQTPKLLAFAKHHALKCITIADLVRYRIKHEQLLPVPHSHHPHHDEGGVFLSAPGEALPSASKPGRSNKLILVMS